MTNDAKKVIDIALAEVGYLEKATNANLDNKTANAGSKNYTKYARDLDALGFYNGRKNGVAWCDVFVDWCMVQAFGKEKALAMTFQPTKAANNCGAGCKYSRNYYKSNKHLFDDPEPGDQVFFFSTDKTNIQHTGLVYKVDEKYIYTVEGNTSGASGVVSNGGGVAAKKYLRTYARLAGFGRPNYSPDTAELPPIQEAPKPTPAEMFHMVVQGETLWGLAKKYLGAGAKYPKIMAANNMKNTILKPGMKLKIPV